MSFDNVQNMLRSNQSLTWRAPPKCPKCHQLFTSSYVKQGVSRRAFILKCDHLMCERCIQDQVYGAPRAAVCRICNIRTILDPKRRIQDQLQYSYQMLGFLYQRQHEVSRLAMDLVGPLAPGGPNTSGALAALPANTPVEDEEDQDKECYECNVSRTRHYCQECDTPLCRDCFEKIHRVGKVLSKHKLCSLTVKKWMRADSSICDEHKLTTVLFCTHCEVRVCTACRNEQHAAHYCAQLVDINREAQPRLEKLLNDLEKAYAMNQQGKKTAERVYEQQKAYANSVLTEITEYFFSLHNVLQTVEQELLVSVKAHFQTLYTESAIVQKELATSEKNLERSIEQFKSFQVALPRQTLLTDLIKDMKKMLHTAPITVHFQEPKENPFRFRERNPLRKEIRDYFELTYAQEGTYRHRTMPYYTPEPFPVLEPIKSPEMAHSPEPQPEPAAPSAVGIDAGASSGLMDHSTASSSHTLKDMEVSRGSGDGRSKPPSAADARDRQSSKSGSKSSKHHKRKSSGKERSSNTRSDVASSRVDPEPSSKPAVVPEMPVASTKERSTSPDVQIISPSTRQRTPPPRHTNSAGGNRFPPKAGGNPYPKRTLGGRLKSQGSTSSAHSGSNQRPPSVPAAEASRDIRMKPVLEINPINPDNAEFIKFSQKVNVTCVINPHKFYVQNQCFKTIVNELCQDDGEVALEPEEIVVGALYLAQPLAERRWYRAKVLSRASKSGKKYEVIYIDYGRTEEIPRDHLRVITDELSEFDAGAYECTLYDLVPADGGRKWPVEARQIMIDFIENKQVIMYTIETNSKSHVDIITQSVDSPKSLRSALIYLKMAKATSKPSRRSEDAARRIDQLEKTMKRWTADSRRRYPARELEKNDMFKTKITFSVSPSEFYICKSSWLEAFTKLQNELADYCTKEGKIAFSPHVGMICAFVEQDADERLIWKRGQVLKVGEAHCEIASVDTGHRLVIPWQDIRYLPKQFSVQPEFSVRCKLMHIQPFKQYNYRWTDEAVRDFNRIASSPSVFQLIVDERVEDRCYDVALYIVKKRVDTCVNGLMVKSGFAVSTGPESAVVERVKELEEEPQNITLGSVGAGGATSANRTLGSKSSSSDKRQSRVRVEILRVVSPGEFYVSLLKNANGIARMQEEIQNKMDDKMDDGDDKTSWKKGELCLVFPTIATGPGSETIGCEWYRARVIEVVDDSNYTVFLIDKAHTMNAHYSNMSTIPAELKQVHPAAIRCFLACIGPIGNQESWSSSVIDAFKVAIEKFQCYSISLHGRSVNDSLPVILWGMTAESAKALSPQLFQYANINNSLVQYGYVHLKEKFQPLSNAMSVEEELLRHYQAFDQFIDDLDVDMAEPDMEPSYSGSYDTYQDDITDEPTPIDRWVPAKPIDKTIFVASPTYVDNNGVIYLHDVEKERTLASLKKVINAKFEGSQQLPNDKFYTNGEPCFAKFHLDDQYYRAIIRKAISPCRYKVQFVDYGNIEECDVKDLRKSIICGRVPILVNKYRLTDVSPKTKDGVWPTDVLDTIHSLIVGKQCQVRVDTDMDTDAAGVVPCFLKVTGEFCIDVAEYLLQHQLAERKRGAFEEKVDLLYDPYTNLRGSNNEAPSPKSGRLRIGANFGTGTETGSDEDPVPEDDDDDRARFSRQEINELLEHVSAEQAGTTEREEGEEDISDENASGVDLNKVQYFYSYGDIKLEAESDTEDGETIEADKKSDEAGTDEVSSNLSFNPNEFDTSTQIDPPLELTRPTLHGYPQFELDESIKGFYCEVTNLVNPFNLFVFPQLDDHIQRMKEMMARIQCYARKHRKCSDIEENMPCLAIFKQDNFWYRGIIEEYFPERAEVRIFYVDYLNKETISVRDILKCPVSLRRVPLRNVQIQLHALRANPRMRESDIMMKLVELIEGKRIYAKVVQRVPTVEVELYTDSKCTNLIYHKMIKEKYFLVGNEPSVPSSSSSSRRRDK